MQIPNQVFISPKARNKVRVPKSARKGSPETSKIKFAFTGASELKTIRETNLNPNNPAPKASFVNFQKADVQKSQPLIKIEYALSKNQLDSLSSSSSVINEQDQDRKNKVKADDVPQNLLRRTIFRNKKLKSSNNLDNDSRDNNQLPLPSKSRLRHRASIARFKGVAKFDKKKQSKWSLLSKNINKKGHPTPLSKNFLSPENIGGSPGPMTETLNNDNSPDHTSSNFSSKEVSEISEDMQSIE